MPAEALTHGQMLARLHVLCVKWTLLKMIEMGHRDFERFLGSDDLREVAEVIVHSSCALDRIHYVVQCMSQKLVITQEEMEIGKRMQQIAEGLGILSSLLQIKLEERAGAALESGTSEIPPQELALMQGLFDDPNMSTGITIAPTCPFSIMGVGTDGNMWHLVGDAVRLQGEVDAMLGEHSEEMRGRVSAFFMEVEEFWTADAAEF